MADHADLGQLWGNNKKMKKKQIFLEEKQKKFIYGVLAILSKTIMTKRQKTFLRDLRPHTSALDVFCSLYSFFPNPQNTTN